MNAIERAERLVNEAHALKRAEAIEAVQATRSYIRSLRNDIMDAEERVRIAMAKAGLTEDDLAE